MDWPPANSKRQHRGARAAFTLVELLTVIFIISLLIGLLMPAVNIARAAARKTVCQNNLRQFGIELHAHAERTGALCTGTFDWLRDGPVTEVGWVADLVNTEVPVGEMLCPTNSARASETLNALVAQPTSTLDACIDRLGRPPRVELDGSITVNPCRQIIEGQLGPQSAPRVALIQTKVLEKFYNTNYVASWFLARGNVALNGSGNVLPKRSGCPTDLRSRNVTTGPLRLPDLDAAKASQNVIPLLADAAVVPELLSTDVGSIPAGTPLARSLSAGPVLKANMQVPSFPANTPHSGVNGWYAGWLRNTLQDYRSFGPVHGNICNILFADGSVRPIEDTNEDGLLNNGFSVSSGGGFADDTVEMTAAQTLNLYSLKAVLNN